MTRKPLISLLLALFAGAAHGAPASPEVVAGQATFAQQGNVFSITNTPNTIINWQSFSVGAGEITRFVQQNADSAVLNRIVGQDPSRILGALQSNGHVFLINPNGILFGKDARVDVNGLTASTLGLSDADFLAGRRRFDAGAVAGSVVNQGSISTPAGGKVFLIAPDVDNSGIISAPDGSVVLAAGRSVTLADSGNPDLHVVVSAPRDQAVNLGQIVAAGGRIGIYGALVRQRGIVNANSAQVGANGKIVFKASADTTVEAGSVTSATGAGSGGSIAVLGERVAVTGNAQLDASGDAGGGSVLVGGDYQGANALLPNARISYFGPQASIRADARVSGNGGKVVLWSRDATRAYGSISAQGGGAGGNGGLVETSGHYLDVNGIVVKAGAPKGLAGTWLLDPFDIEIVYSGATGALTDVDEFADGGQSGVTQINGSALSAVNYTTNIVLQAQHDIMFKAEVQRKPSTKGSLSVEAGNNIVIDSLLDSSGGALVLQAGVGNYMSGDGGVYIHSGVKTGNGSFFASGREVVIESDGIVDAGSGSITINSGGGFRINSGSQLRGSSQITVAASSISVLGTIGPSTTQLPSVTLLGAASHYGINVSNTVLEGIALNLLPDDLMRIHASSLNLGDQTTMGKVSVESPLSLAPALVNTLNIETQADIAINAQLNMGTGSSLTLRRYVSSGGSISVGKTGSLAADSITLRSDNIQLDGAVSTTTNGGSGMVKIAPHYQASVVLGSGATDSYTDNGAVLGLDSTELARISTGQLGIGSTSGITVTGLDLSKGFLAASALTLGSTDGAIAFTGPLSTLGQVFLIAPSITSANSTATVTAPSLTIESTNAIGVAGAPLYTATKLLRATNNHPGGRAPIVIENTGNVSLAGVVQGGTGNQGDISVTNTGGMTLLGGDSVRTQGNGQVSLLTHSPLTINGSVVSEGGQIALEAGNAGVLTVAQTGSVTSTSGAIGLTGGSVVNNGSVTSTSGNIAVSGTVSGAGTYYSSSGSVSGVQTTGNCLSYQLNTNCTGAETLPSLSSCIANPSLTGCASVLPSMSTCLSSPSSAGCSVVLPSLDSCVANPGATGCGVVLPSLDNCVASPTASGCSAVLPTLSSCIASPTAAGCSVVLPNLSSCVVSPTAAGCSVVLPTLSSCVANPAASGCAVVLPTLSSCIASPTAAGWSVVLPTLSSCVASPTAAGCSVVLPTLPSCEASPTAAGCSVVLPTLSSCVASPTAAGCSVVLPTLSSCIANPAASGCGVVLPSLAACIVTPTASGCSVVLPSIAACTANPAAAGCAVVLPSLAQCTVSPAQAGCVAVLPSLSACVGTPTAAGCSVVLPTLASCIASPASTGCAVVLPSLASCVANPAAPGCSVVLPTLSACIATPAAAGCPVVLPTLAQCTDTPTLQGCAVVLPPVSACVANPNAPGCVVVVPPTTPEPGSHVEETANTVVAVINEVTTKVAQSKPADSAGEKAKPAKKEEKLAAIADDSKLEGGKSAKPVKTYCN